MLKKKKADSRHTLADRCADPGTLILLSPSKGGRNGTAIQILTGQNSASAVSQHSDSIRQKGIIPKVAISSHCLLNDTTTQLVRCDGMLNDRKA